jgi:hypothetical protein
MPTVTRKRVAKSKAVSPKAKVREATKRAATVSKAKRETTAAKATARPTTRATKPAAENKSQGIYQRHEYKPMESQAHARTIAKRIREGESFMAVSREYGAPTKVRRFLAANGFDTSGGKAQVPDPIKGSGKTLAARIAKLRQNHEPWFKIEIATGKPERALKALLAEHGYGELAYGRIRRDGTIVGNVNGKRTTTPPKAAAKTNGGTKRGRRPKAVEAEEPVAKRPAAKRTRPKATASTRTAKRAAAEPESVEQVAKPARRARRIAAAPEKATVARPRRVSRARSAKADPSVTD